MKIYTVLCISHELETPQVVVSNFVDLNKAQDKFDDYKTADDEFYTIKDKDVGDVEALNTVLDHFTALLVDSEEKVEEVFLIETEE